MILTEQTRLSQGLKLHPEIDHLGPLPPNKTSIHVQAKFVLAPPHWAQIQSSNLPVTTLRMTLSINAFAMDKD